MRHQINIEVGDAEPEVFAAFNTKSEADKLLRKLTLVSAERMDTTVTASSDLFIVFYKAGVKTRMWISKCEVEPSLI